jgi:hypothetical protein
MTHYGRDKVMDLESVKTRLGISWGALLIGSALPERLLGLPYPSASFNWLSVMKTKKEQPCSIVVPASKKKFS